MQRLCAFPKAMPDTDPNDLVHSLPQELQLSGLTGVSGGQRGAGGKGEGDREVYVCIHTGDWIDCIKCQPCMLHKLATGCKLEAHFTTPTQLRGKKTSFGSKGTVRQCRRQWEVNTPQLTHQRTGERPHKPCISFCLFSSTDQEYQHQKHTTLSATKTEDGQTSR